MWAEVLQNVADDLPNEVSETIRDEVEVLATRSIAQAGTEFQCSTEFLARRAKNQLQRLKQMINGQTPDVLPPEFCLVAQAAIDLSTDPSSWDTITLHGYDLDLKDTNGLRIRFGMVNPSNELYYELEEVDIGRTTHYQITLSMRDLADEIYEQKIKKIVPIWDGELGNRGAGEVVIEPWVPKKRLVNNHEPNITTYIPPKVGDGDSDFDTSEDEAMEVEAEAEIKRSSQQILGHVYLRAREPRYDYTEASGWSPWSPLYTAPSGWKVISVVPNTESRLEISRIRGHSKHVYERPAGEVVNRFNIWGDTNGNDIEGYTRIEADWSLMEIQLEETQPSWYTPPKLTFSWSNNGSIDGLSCTQIVEGRESEETTWHDNYLCSNIDLGMEWSMSGAIPDKTCIQWIEPGEPLEMTWRDNYLCFRSDAVDNYVFRWSYQGVLSHLNCVQIVEPKDPHIRIWEDNYFCY